MKKLVGLLLAVTLVFGMSTVAFAAGSKSETVSRTETAEGAKVADVDVTSEEAVTAGIEKTSDGKVTISEEKLTEIKSEIKAEKVQILDVFEVSAPAGYTEGTAIDITMPGITWQDGITVLHFQDGKWVTLPTKQGTNNTVVATFTKFSPTAIAIVSTAATPATTDSSSDATTSGKSPKTGDNLVVYVALIALAAGASALVAKRKFA